MPPKAGGSKSLPSFEEELAQDVIEIITVFSARLYGSRSHKTRKLLATLKDGSVAEETALITKSMTEPTTYPGKLLQVLQALHLETMFRLLEKHNASGA